jgi:hypothetical protein
VAGVLGSRCTGASRGTSLGKNILSWYMDANWLRDAANMGGSGGGATLVVMLVVALLVGALAWWYLGRDDDDEKRPVLTMGVGPFVDATFVRVAWQFDANDATFQSYQLQFHRKDSPAVISTVDGTFDDVGKTNHTFGGLEAGTAYVFRVTARTDLADATGTVAATTRLNQITGSVQTPAEPETPKVTLTGATGGSLTFDVSLGSYGDAEPVGEAEIAYRAWLTNRNGEFTLWSTIVETSTAVITGLMQSTGSYDVRIKKWYSLGEGPTVPFYAHFQVNALQMEKAVDGTPSELTGYVYSYIPQFRFNYHFISANNYVIRGQASRNTTTTTTTGDLEHYVEMQGFAVYHAIENYLMTFADQHWREYELEYGSGTVGVEFFNFTSTSGYAVGENYFDDTHPGIAFGVINGALKYRVGSSVFDTDVTVLAGDREIISVYMGGDYLRFYYGKERVGTVENDGWSSFWRGVGRSGYSHSWFNLSGTNRLWQLVKHNDTNLDLGGEVTRILSPTCVEGGVHTHCLLEECAQTGGTAAEGAGCRDRYGAFMDAERFPDRETCCSVLGRSQKYRWTLG